MPGGAARVARIAAAAVEPEYMRAWAAMQYLHSQECPLSGGTPVLPPPKGREATRAHVKRQYGRWRQSVEPINDPLTRPLGQPCPGAWPAHGLLTRSAAKLAAGNLGLWLHHLCGRPALALTTLFPGSSLTAHVLGGDYMLRLTAFPRREEPSRKPTVWGKANVRKMIASIFAPAHRAEFKLLNVFGHGDRVITERVDQWDWDGSGTWQLQLPVCGMFELTEDGKIYEWREYYDNEHWSKNGGPSLVL